MSGQDSDSLPSSGSAGRWFDETGKTLLLAILIALLVRNFLFQPFNIPSSSMVPGLLVGDYLFVSKYAYGYSSRSTLLGLLPISGRLGDSRPQRGDVVVFKLPRDNSTDYIKRVVGLPGDRIQVKDGLLYVNGVPVRRQRLEEPEALKYLTPTPDSVDYEETFPDGHRHIIREDGDDFALDNTGVYTVPERHYFMMGDNRDNSQDSRTATVRFVPEDNLVGRAEFLFFSLGEGTPFWKIWRWPLDVRWGRFLKKIR